MACRSAPPGDATDVTMAACTDHTHLVHPPAHPADQIYGGSRQDVLYRCALLSKAALEAPRLLPGGEAGALGEGCLFVANDFHAALVPVYLQGRLGVPKGSERQLLQQRARDFLLDGC